MVDVLALTVALATYTFAVKVNPLFPCQSQKVSQSYYYYFSLLTTETYAKEPAEERKKKIKKKTKSALR